MSAESACGASVSTSTVTLSFASPTFESPDEARARRVREGVPPAVIESALAIAAYQRAGGKTVTITNTIADLTGRPPRTVAEFVREYASSFRG